MFQILILGILLLTAEATHAQQTSPPTLKLPDRPKIETVMAYTEKEGMKTLMEKQVRLYLENRPEATWWIKTVPTNGIEQIVAFLPRLEKEQVLVVETLNKIAVLHPETDRIAKRFKDFRPTFFRGGYSMTTFPAGSFAARKHQTPGLNELSFAPKDTGERNRSGVFWRGDWKALVVSAIEWPLPVLGGLLAHELGHGYDSMVLSHLPSPDSEDERKWLENREQDLNDLQIFVMNQLSKGAYQKELDVVLDRIKPKGKHVSELYLSLTREELNRLDNALEAANAPTVLAVWMLPYHFIALGWRAIEREAKGNLSPPPSALPEKTLLFRWLRNTTMR